MVGGGLAFAVVAALCGEADNVDVAMFGPVYYGIPAGLVGGLIGAAIGIVAGEKADDSSSPDSLGKRPQREEYCQNCGSQLAGDAKTCKWCGADVK